MDGSNKLNKENLLKTIPHKNCQSLRSIYALIITTVSSRGNKIWTPMKNGQGHMGLKNTIK